MNFIKVFFKITVFFLTSLVALPLPSYTQGKPLRSEKEIVSHNFSVPHSLFKESIKDYYFDDNGGLIFSSGQKIGFFNGINWDFLSLESSSAITNSPNGSAFIAIGSTIFSLQVDTGQSYYLSEFASISTTGDETIKQIVGLNKGLLINTEKKLHYLIDSELQILIDDGENIWVYKTDSRLLIKNKNNYTSFSENNGLGSWANSSLDLEHFEDHPKGFIAYSKSDNSIFILSPSFTKLYSWEQNLRGNIQDVININTNHYGIISDEGTFFVVNSEGEVLSQTEVGGLNRNSKMEFSPYGRLWISTSTGFTVFDFSTGLQKIKLPELPSGIVSTCISNGSLYLSDNHSLFQIPENIVVNQGRIKDLEQYKDGVLYLKNKQLHFFKNSKETLVWSAKLLGYQKDPISNNILLEEENHFTLITEESQAKFKKILEYNKNMNQDFLFYDNSLIYNKKNSIYIQNLVNQIRDSLTFVPENSNEKILQIIAGINGYIVGTQGNVFLIGIDTIQKIDLSVNDTENLHQKFIPSNNKHLLTYWIESKDSPGFLKIILSDGNQEMIPYLESNIQNLNILRKNSGEYLLYSSDDIYSYSPNELENQRKIYFIPERIRINGKDVFSGQNFKLAKANLWDKLNQIPFRNNSFILDFNSSDFFSSNLSFQYHLMGRDKGWSDWQKGNSLTIERLKPGDYLLKIRLANEKSYISESFKINFSILPPFYFSSFAILLYILIVIASIFVFYKLYLVRSHKLPEIKEDIVKVEAFHKSEPEFEDKNEMGAQNATNSEPKRKSKWDKYEMVTVLFSDIQGFTKIAEQMNPERLIDELDQFFYHFDSIVDKYNIEKIKTIGDAYMAAGGIPQKNNTNPLEVVLAALEVQYYMRDVKKKKMDIWDLRIGIHSGPVIAGVVGHKKRTYDIWGDTVNIASRMESSGEGGKVNISGVTYNLIKDFFLCEYRGKIPVKYKGNLDMYFVKGLRPELSINLVGLPNKKFFLKLQLQRLIDLENHVFGKLEEELVKEMYFHNVDYAKQVYNHSLLIAKAENLDVEEILEVRTASLILSLGYLINYQNPEAEAGNIARQILGEFQYSERQINIICNLILSTKFPCEPQNILEQVMADAKMEYLGRADYIKIYRKLFLEESAILGARDPKKWKQAQVDKLKQFEYFTSGARRLREISFENQIIEIEKDNL